MRNTSVLDIASHVGIGATLIGDDLEEGGTSGPRSAEHENHLAWSQNTRVPGKKIRIQRRRTGLEGVLVDDCSNRWWLQQPLRENWLEHVAENNKREGDQFGDGICPRSQEKAIEKS